MHLLEKKSHPELIENHFDKDYFILCEDLVENEFILIENIIELKHIMQIEFFDLTIFVKNNNKVIILSKCVHCVAK